MQIIKFISVLSFALTTACAFHGATKDAGSVTVRVIAFNDFHGNLQSPGDFLGVSSGGVDYLAGYVNLLKQEHTYHVVVSAGDLTGASPLLSGAFHDEGTIETINRLGLEFNAVGNHEFDDGRDELLRKQNGGCHPGGVIGQDTCLGSAVTHPVPVPYPYEGAKFKYLSANVVVNATGKTLFPAYGIKSFATDSGKKIDIGFIGMTLKATPSITSPVSVDGLSFLDEVQTVNKLIPTLRALGVEAIVVLIHQGGQQGSTEPNAINDCSLQSGGVDSANALQPLRQIVQGLDNAVDLVVSGHTHKEYTCRLPNRSGRFIPVTQAGSYGRVLTSIDLSIDLATGDVIDSSFHKSVVDRSNSAITPDSTIKSIVDAYHAHISPIEDRVVATILGPVLNAELPARSPATGTTGELPAGDLIADAMFAATAKTVLGAAQIAFTNMGGVRSDFANKGISQTYPHQVTYGDSYKVQPFGNHLVTMNLTAQQLKDGLEMQFPGNACVTPSGINHQDRLRFLQPSNGFYFSWSETGANCHKIRDVRLTTYDSSGNVASIDTIVSNGIPVSMKTYRVTVNNYIAEGGDNMTAFQSGTARIAGMKDIDATLDYLAQFKTPNPNNNGYDPNAPSLHKPRIEKLQ